MLLAILNAIELARPDAFATYAAAREYLLKAGKAARVVSRCVQGRQVLYESDPGWVRYQFRAAEADRRAFLDYVERLEPEDAARVPAPPFRHALGERDRADILSLLKPRWGVDLDLH